MKSKYYIGIDLGTSAVKLLLVDEGGKVVRTESREYPLIFPYPGWSEQNPGEWWNGVKSGITALIASLGVCVGLAVNGALSNLAGGVLIMFTRPFKVDDFIALIDLI